ncbi:MAG: hypothetical protein MZV64_44860 [Ignavibacteriales bacterium]|nr:hypothetical protein [Ignavibacteriales bacterium]
MAPARLPTSTTCSRRHARWPVGRGDRQLSTGRSRYCSRYSDCRRRAAQPDDAAQVAGTVAERQQRRHEARHRRRRACARTRRRTKASSSARSGGIGPALPGAAALPSGRRPVGRPRCRVILHGSSIMRPVTPSGRSGGRCSLLAAWTAR